METRIKASFFFTSIALLLIFFLPTINKAQTPDASSTSTQTPTGKGVMETLSNLMVKRNQAVLMGVVQEVNLEKHTIKILDQTIDVTTETSFLGGTKGLAGLKVNRVIIITVQNIDSKLKAVEIFKMPNSSYKAL